MIVTDALSIEAIRPRLETSFVGRHLFLFGEVESTNHLDAWALRHRKEGAAVVLAAWRDRDILTGRRVSVRSDGAGFDGRVQGVNGDGQLVVQDSLGRRHVIVTEEIRPLD